MKYTPKAVLYYPALIYYFSDYLQEPGAPSVDVITFKAKNAINQKINK